MKGIYYMLGLILAFAVSCGDTTSGLVEKEANAKMLGDSQAPLLEPPALPDSIISRFLHSEPGTYGWETKADDISLDFFPDGRLHIQGPDGEATMWQGSWKVKDGMLVMHRPDLGRRQSLPVILDGDRLMIGERVYTRYRP